MRDFLHVSHALVQIFNGLETEEHWLDRPLCLGLHFYTHLVEEVSDESFGGLWIVGDELVEIGILLFLIKLLPVYYLLGEQCQYGNVEVLHVLIDAVLLI